MYELQVEGMSCGHCVATVDKLVKRVDGQAKVEVDLPTQKVRIESGAALKDLVDALEDGGYPVRASAQP